MGSCVDDRNIRGSFDTVIKAFHEMARYDDLAGHFNNINKLAMTATTLNARKQIQQYNIGTPQQPVYPRLFSIEKNVGDFINATKHNATKEIDKIMHYAISSAIRTSQCPTTQALKAKGVATLVIPRMLQGTQWTLPSTKCLKGFRTCILTAIWSTTRA